MPKKPFLGGQKNWPIFSLGMYPLPCCVLKEAERFRCPSCNMNPDELACSVHLLFCKLFSVWVCLFFSCNIMVSSYHDHLCPLGRVEESFQFCNRVFLHVDSDQRSRKSAEIKLARLHELSKDFEHVRRNACQPGWVGGGEGGKHLPTSSDQSLKTLARPWDSP